MLSDDEIMAQVLAAFQEEQAEHRQAAADLLLELERTPNHPQRQALVDQLFREAHSLKGGARAAGVVAVEQLAHKVEDVFSAVRRNQLTLTPDVCDPVYAALDAVGAIMRIVGTGHDVSLDPYQPLIATLSAIMERATPNGNGNGEIAPTSQETTLAELATPVKPQALADAPEPEVPVETPQPAAAPVAPEEARDGASTTVRLSTVLLDHLLNETGELITCTVRAQQRAREARELAELPARWRRIWRQTRPVVARTQKRAASNGNGTSAEAERTNGAAHVSQGDLATLLEALNRANTMIGELEQRVSLQAHRMIEDHVRLAAVTDRLHDQVRRTRMLPLTTLFSPLRVQVREMVRSANRQVMLELDDGGAEADRQVLDGLREALIHLLRNAIDHGIEPSEARIRAGKTPEGHIILRSFVSGDRLTLTVSDDGAGLDIEAIRRRALVDGQFAENDLTRADGLTDLIFQPGFSTRSTVSALSGRGVGLDIVRATVERMHGRVSVTSTPGAGCTFTINVPLSLTSSHGLLLQANNACYLLPIDAVQRIVPATPQHMRQIEGRATLMLDGKPVPLVALTDLLGVERQTVSDRMGQLALLIGSGDRLVACTVDSVLGEQELVAQRLPAPLRRVRGIAGATILADGSVVPILDAVDLLRAALRAQRPLSPVQQVETAHETPTVLVVDDSITTRTLEKNILEAAGYKVQLATDGAEALRLLGQMAENGGCNLLISDVDMPHLNGFDLTAKVRSSDRFRHLPIVLVTSLDTPADRERGIAAGADAYIVKRTFDQRVLLDTIERLI